MSFIRIQDTFLDKKTISSLKVTPYVRNHAGTTFEVRVGYHDVKKSPSVFRYPLRSPTDRDEVIEYLEAVLLEEEKPCLPDS